MNLVKAKLKIRICIQQKTAAHLYLLLFPLSLRLTMTNGG